MARRLMARALAATGMTVLLALALTAPAIAEPGDEGAKGNPPGNNGTIKVDAAPFDDHPNNEPHVDCEFEIDFYGFDEGDLWADVEFALQAPTGSGALDAAPARVFIGEDAAGGGTDLDAHQPYDLTDAFAASGAEPHPEQGYHVKLTIHADGSQGADVKHKVFWVEPCGTAPGGDEDVAGDDEDIDTGGDDDTDTDTGGDVDGDAGGNETTTGAVGGNDVLGVSFTAPQLQAAPTVAATSQPAAQVLGTQFERTAPTNLARTGFGLGVLVLIGLGMVAGGLGLTRRSKRTS